MKRLKELRKLNNLTQKNVADAIGVGMQAYAYYEKDEREPSPETLCKLADYFGVTVDELLGRTSPAQLFDDARVPKTEIQELFDGLRPEQQENVLIYARALNALNDGAESSSKKRA